MSASGPQKSSTTQSSSQQQTGASDHSQAVTSFGSGPSAGGNIEENHNSFSFSGNKGDISVEQSDPGTLRAISGDAFAAVEAIIAGQSAAQTQREAFQATTWEQGLASQLGAITELGKTTATGGASDLNKTVLGIGVAIALAVAAIFIFKK